MSSFRPDAAQERWLVLGARYDALASAAHTPGRTGGWTTVRPWIRVLLFALGLFAALMGGVILAIAQMPGAGAVSGVLLLVIAEMLIQGRRMFWSGFEEALWFAGIVALGVQYMLSSNSWNHDDTLFYAIPAVAGVIAGLRLLNPLLTTAGTALASLAIADTLRHRVDSWSGTALVLGCYGLATLALLLGGLRLRRPSHDRMLDGLVIVMPLVGYAWMQLTHEAPLTLASLRAAPSVRLLLPVLLPLVFAVVALLTGLRRRTHAPLIAALACLLCIAHALRDFTGMALHWRLIFWGLITLGICLVLDRRLREPRRGITTQPLGNDLASQPLVQIAGAVRLGQPGAQQAAPQPSFQGDGGGFGGGGASGKF